MQTIEEKKNEIINRLAEIQPVMLDEPQAFKKACIRLGYDMAVLVLMAEEPENE